MYIVISIFPTSCEGTLPGNLLGTVLILKSTDSLKLYWAPVSTGSTVSYHYFFRSVVLTEEILFLVIFEGKIVLEFGKLYYS